VLGLYAVVRWRVLGGVGVPHIPFYDNPTVDASTGVRLLTATTVIGRGLLLLLAPITLSPDYSYAVIPLITSLLDWRFLLTAAAVVAGGGLAWMRRRTAPVALFAVLWYGFTLLPASNLFLPVGTIFGERLLYLPSLAFCLVAGVVAARVLSRLTAARVGLVVALFVVGLGMRTVAYARHWSDEARLFRYAAKVVPGSTKVWLKLGDLRRERGETGPARDAYERALAIAPENYKAKLGLASVLTQLGQVNEARRLQREVVDSRPRDPDVLHALGLRFRRQGDLEAAADCWRRALLMNPDHVQSLGDLGSFYVVTGDAAKAETYLERAVAVKPLHPTAWYNLGFLYERTGRPAEARAAWRRFLATAGEDLAAERARVEEILSRGE
jgi:cytochrome c-type biogenesis protein CcmH/NrfG